MSEIRLNLVTRDWVIIETSRAKRPEDFKHYEDRPIWPSYLETCPFCPGNEGKTAEEFFRLDADGGWKLRVVANKYPAVTRHGEKKRITEETRHSVTGVGLHEIIVESPVHNAVTALTEAAYMEEIIRVYRDRFIEAHRDPRIEHVIIFKNCGERAGTTIVHPHSQLIGIPVVPVKFRDRVQAAMHYFDDTGECMNCDILKMEVKDGRRIILDSPHFLTFIPYAALSPFHTWIIPKRHSASFSDITDEEIKDLSIQLKTTLFKIYLGLENPDYNYVIRSSRPRDLGNAFSHWYFSIIPRVSEAAGFELGTGMYINTSIPERSAAYLRDLKA